MPNEVSQPDMAPYTVTIVLPDDVPEEQRTLAHQLLQVNTVKQLLKRFESETGLSADEYAEPHASVTTGHFTVTLSLKKAVPKTWKPTG